MDTKKFLVKAALIISGAVILVRTSSMTNQELEQTILAPWTKLVTQAFGASLVGLGTLLPSGHK